MAASKLFRRGGYDMSVAKDMGFQAAAVLDIVAHWILYNARNDDNRVYREGKWWTFGSAAQWTDYIPLSEDAIRRTLDKLVDAGYLIKGRHNANAYNRTLWYAMTPKSEALYLLGDNAPAPAPRTTTADAPAPKAERRTAKTALVLPEGVQDVLDHYKTIAAFRQPSRVTVKLAELIADKVQEHGVDTVKAVIDRAAADSFYTSQWTSMSIIDFFSPSKKTDEFGEHLDGPFDRIVADVERDRRRQAAQTQAAAEARQAADTGIRTLSDAIGYLTINGIYDPTDGYIDRDAYEQAAKDFPEEIKKEIEANYLN
jgi:hypothetical protein